MTHKPLITGFAAILTTAATLVAGPASNPTPAPAPAADTGWLLDFNAGLSLTRGNTDSLGLGLGLDAERRWNGWQVIGKGSYSYTELADITTGNSLRLGLQLNRDLTDRWYVGIANSFTYDEIAALDYRYQIAAVLGYRVWTTDRSELTLEAGPGYSWERQAGLSDDYATIRFGERFKYKLSENSRFIQSLEYQPAINDFGRFTLVAEAAITARIVGNLWWRTAIRDIYSSEPPFGLEKNDLQLTAGITWGLGDPDSKPAPAAKIRKKSDVAKPAAAPSRPEGVWQTTASVGFSLTKGNAENLLLVGDISTSMVSKPHEYFVGIGGAYGEVSQTRTVQDLHGSAQYNRLLNHRFYIGVGINALTDEVADLDYRVTPAAIIGYKLIDTDRVSLRFEAGPGYSWEKQGGISRDYFTLVARERLEIAISESAKLWQGVTAQIDVSDSENYVLTAEVGVDFWLTESISVRTVASDIYDNKPGIGVKSNDFRLTSGIAISF